MCYNLVSVKKLVFLLFFIIFSSNFVLAENEVPVNIKADKLKFSEDTGLVTASGSVEIKLEDVTIHSDHLVMDTKTNIVTAEGNIKMHGPQYDAGGKLMTYYVNDETSSFSDFKTEASPSGVKGHLYISAGKLKESAKVWDGSEGSITTCDYAKEDSSHYHAMSKKIEYYPDDKIVGWSNTFYLGNVPCFWMPYIIYDLKGKRKKNWNLGHNEVEGDFIKTSWDYPYGSIYLDQMSKKGFGHGLDYNYNLDQKGKGSIYLYLLNENEAPNTKDRVLKLNHAFQLTPATNLSLAFSSSNMYLIPSGRVDNTTYHADFDYNKDNYRLNSFIDALDNRAGNQQRLVYQASRNKDSFNTNYNFNLDQGRNEPRYVRISQRLNHSQPFLFKNGTLNFNANYSDSIQRVGIPGDELLDLSYAFNDRESLYSIKIYENQHIDLDRDLYLGDEGDQYLERKPEITLSPNPVDLKLFTLSPSFMYGYYREVQQVQNYGKRDFSSGRYSASLNASKSVPLILGSTFGLSYGVNQYLYDPGDELYSQTENYTLDTGLFNAFKNNVTFTRGITEGNTPFFFDRLGTKYSNIRDTTTLYYGNYINWMITGGYNYETKTQFNTDTTLTINPVQYLSTRFITGWDPTNMRFLDLSSNASVTFDKLSNSTTLLNDLNSGQLKSGSNLFDLEIADEKDWGNHWHFKLGHVYNPDKQDFKLVDVSVIKDLHCWEVKYTYSDYRREFSFTFTLKAFPGDPIGYTGDRGFYFDSFEKSINEELKNESPSRY